MGMTSWSPAEERSLAPIVDALVSDLEPLAGKRILVLCAAGGQVAVRIAARVGDGEVVGLELDERLLAAARHSRGALPMRFERASLTEIPHPAGSFDGVVSEFIVYPTTQAAAARRRHDDRTSSSPTSRLRRCGPC